MYPRKTIEYRLFRRIPDTDFTGKYCPVIGLSHKYSQRNEKVQKTVKKKKDSKKEN
ncbi:hypothetical protein [Methanosarcina acetivorans]|uniref:hypothetical protein n=1 Tax=Methanosarcina acetivorans TaxID=2214 RepID=UPI000A986625|nr:hypothetical protein [Methanosarcina acetivorans]